MATLLNIPALPKFQADSDPTSLATRWKKWRDRFDVYSQAIGVIDDKQKRALLLHLAGDSVQDVFDGLPDTGEDFKTASDKLNEYFLPKKNIRFERYVFKQESQRSGESVSQFVTRLRSLASTCEFTNVNDAIADQVVEKCQSSQLKRQILRKPDITLDKILELATAMESSETQTNQIDHLPESINYMSHTKPTYSRRHPVGRFSNNQRQCQSNTTCGLCGGIWPHINRPCPAKGVTCSKCGTLNHFATVCRKPDFSKRQSQSSYRGTNEHHQSVKSVHRHNNRATKSKSVNQITEERSSSDDDYVFKVSSHQSCKRPFTSVTFADTCSTYLLVDTGASVNIIDQPTFTYLKSSIPIQLNPPTTTIYVYGSDTPLSVLGTFKTIITVANQQCESVFHVTDQDSGSLLGYETSQKLGLIAIPDVNAVSPLLLPQQSSPIIKEFQDIFQGMGKLKDYQFKIHIDETVKPTAQPVRRIPFHTRKQVEAELAKLQADDIIEEVDGPTPWVSPIVIVPKKDKKSVRICVDMRSPNQAVTRQRHPTPTLDEIIHDLNGASVFSKLDLKQGYHQIELHQSSRYLTTFATHIGLRRYKRLLFGLSSASEIFQHIIQQVLDGIPGVKNISDDIIVFGKSTEEHNTSLRKVFCRLREKNLTLNINKCLFNQTKLNFFGFTFSSEGISPDPSKVLAIQQAPVPQDAAAVRSLLGMTNFLARFIPNHSIITDPLRDLTKKGTKWVWTEKHQQSFQNLTNSLSVDNIISYFDPTKNTEIIADASPVGVGAILTQTDDDGTRYILGYASRTLTAVERRYSQIEREALAIVWASERFHLYVYGKPFIVITDHKPLETLFNKPLSRPPPRIERWQLRLQSYTMKVVYRPGATNPADFLSRHPQPIQSVFDRCIADEYINYIADHAVPKSLTFHQIQEATTSDPSMRKLIQAISSGHWLKSDPDLKPFYKLRNQLSVTSSVVLRDSKLVIPPSLRKTILDLAHEGHQGIVKTKRLLREKVWYPLIDKDAEDLIRSCIPCQASCTGTSSRPEPLVMTELPIKAWSHVSVDFCGPFPSGDSLLVVMDDYSRYPEVEVVKSTAAQRIIPKLDKIFSTHGIVDILKSDNGPPFNGRDFAQYAVIKGFKHRKITPYWPKANGEAERFMRTIEKSIRSSFIEGKEWKRELYQFLLNYKATPHSSTGVSPAELLFNRPIKTKLPENPSPAPACKNKLSNLARENDKRSKRKMKLHADKINRAKPSSLSQGDFVLVKQAKTNKLSTPFTHHASVVIDVKGSMVVLKAPNGKLFARNSSQLKQIPCDTPQYTPSDDHIELDDNVDPGPIDNQPDDRLNHNNPHQLCRRSRRRHVRPRYLNDYVLS